MRIQIRQGMNSIGNTLQRLNAPHLGDTYYEAYKLFYNSIKSYDDLISVALNGTGAMSSKDGVFRQYIGQNAVIGLVILALHERLEHAVKELNASNHESMGYCSLGDTRRWAAAHGH